MTEITKAQEIITNTLTLLGLMTDQFSITPSDKQFDVQIDLPETDMGIFIGYQGETLASIQLLLGIIISDRLGDWYRIKLNIGDYRERRTDALYQKVDQAIQRALDTQQEIIIPNLNSYERRLVHEYISSRTDVTTESRGNTPYRQLYILPSLA